ncbi:hypothetical protein TFLX_01835 [Thermoflexales bacterium]|nr:hypothetical protein TFLX_01835 [Thermoflexales bacterium]
MRQRESEIFNKLKAVNKGPLADESVESIFHWILHYSLLPSLRQTYE